ncbi:MAG TPA: hypothetical protein VMX13_13635 [Sedimentisphaerales bacterium]|nr:hypothetical protein [Sedimentisphaerales bacterium]
MRRLVLVSGCVIALAAVAGCQKHDNNVRVAVEGDGRFPPKLAGTWKDGKRGWEFVIEPDGTISSGVIENGSLRVFPNKQKVVTVSTKRGTGVYELGPWTVQYSPDQRELSVGAVVEHYKLDMGSFAMEGNSTDWFTGPVSDDGRTWEAQWFSFPKAVASAEGEDDLVFEQDPNDNPVETLVFQRQ